MKVRLCFPSFQGCCIEDSLVLNLQDEPYQYLYTQDNKAYLLSLESFEEAELPLDTCEGGEDAAAMLEGNRLPRALSFSLLIHVL